MPYNLDIPGWMPEPELRILERLARTIPAGGAMLEVGPFCGRSSWCWSKSVAADVSVTCVDIWDPVEHPFSPPSCTVPDAEVGDDFGRISASHGNWGTRENFDHYTRDCTNITAIRGHSPNDFRDWPYDSLDLVFLDGIHHNPGFHRSLRSCLVNPFAFADRTGTILRSNERSWRPWGSRRPSPAFRPARQKADGLKSATSGHLRSRMNYLRSLNDARWHIWAREALDPVCRIAVDGRPLKLGIRRHMERQ